MENPIMVLDFGNTYQKCAIFENNQFDLHSFENIVLEDIQKILKGKAVKGVILSSVINYDEEIKTWLNQNYHFIELTHETPIPIKNLYKTPETLGKDRLAAAVGAAYLFPKQNVLSIDCGTAIKYDMVNKDGEYLGGGIGPGLKMRFKALHTFTDKLPLKDFTSVPELIGNNTENSIASGVVNGMLAEIEGIIERYRQDFKNLNVILTGGEMIYFEKSIKSTIFADSNLVLMGMHQILIYNQQNNNE